MTTTAQLKQVADAIEGLAGSSTTANATAAGYWKRIAVGAEALLGINSAATDTATGYARRTAVAFTISAGTSFSGYGMSVYEAAIANALEVLNGQTYTGSAIYRIILALADYTGGAAGTPLSAPSIDRTSGPTTYPMTIEASFPVEWDLAAGSIRVMAEWSTDPTFLTGVTQGTPALVTDPDLPLDLSLADIVSQNLVRITGWQGGNATPPAGLSYSNIVGVGDTTAPTITSGDTITLTSGNAATLSLTADEPIQTWAITGGANADQFSVVGATLHANAQTASGAYAVEVTATDYYGNDSAPQTITATLTLIEFSSLATNKSAGITLSGTPKLTATGTNGAGSEQNVRTSATASGKRALKWTPTRGTDQISMGVDDGTVDYSGYGHVIGVSSSNGIVLTVNGTDWYIQHSGGYQQSGGGSPDVAGDEYMLEFDTDPDSNPATTTGSYSFFRVRGGVKTQLGTTVTGIPIFNHAVVTMKSGASIPMIVAAASMTPAPTAGYTGFGD